MTSELVFASCRRSTQKEDDWMSVLVCMMHHFSFLPSPHLHAVRFALMISLLLLKAGRTPSQNGKEQAYAKELATFTATPSPKLTHDKEKEP